MKAKTKRRIRGVEWAQDVQAADIANLHLRIADLENRLHEAEGCLDRLIVIADQKENSTQ